MTDPRPALAASSRAAPRLEPQLLFLAYAMLPHVVRLPVWVLCLALGAAVWAWGADRRRWPGASVVVRGALAVGGAALALLQGGAGLVGNGLVALAVVLALKPLELRGQRDRWALAILALFLVLTNCIFAESLLMTGYLLGAAMGFAMLCQHFVRPGDSPRRLARLAGGLLWRAAPFMLALFVLFPRLPAGLFTMPATIAATGVKDSMQPGEVSELARDTRLAFRAEFQGAPPPPPRQRYWRGITLWAFDGRAWTRGVELPPRHLAGVRGEGLAYTVILEPRDTPWLYGLDLPVRAPGMHALQGGLLLDFTLRARNPVTQRLRYEVVSIPEAVAPLAQGEADFALRLPEGGNPRARALGRELAARHPRSEDRVLAMLRLFHEEPFHYTLEPPRLGRDSIDEFLFVTRRGFCEHYASAFAFVLRAAGVPTRVVMGYQGGQVNPVGNYISVRQSEAHAWNEVGIAQRGWLRMDPTAAVSPDRVEDGLEQALSDEERRRWFPDSLGGRLDWPWLVNALETVSFHWHSLVLGYGAHQQWQLLRRLGLDIRGLWGRLGLAGLGLGILTGLSLLTLWRLRRSRSRRFVEPVEEAYALFCATLARAGLPRSPGQGPLDHLRQVIQTRPDLAAAAEAVVRRYVALRYALPPGTRPDPAAVAAFARCAREFRVRRPPPGAVSPENGPAPPR